MRRGRLLVISGPSGVGKGTLCRCVMDGDDNISCSISMTTRLPRAGEIDGISYDFVDTETFERTIARGGFLEHAKVYDNYYGTPKAQVAAKLDAGTDVILEIDVQGAMQIKKSCPDGVFIFILPPSMEELRARITGRGKDSPEVIEKRMDAARREISFLDEYDYFIFNDDLDEAAGKLRSIIEAEHCRVNDDISSVIDKY